MANQGQQVVMCAAEQNLDFNCLISELSCTNRKAGTQWRIFESLENSKNCELPRMCLEKDDTIANTKKNSGCLYLGKECLDPVRGVPAPTSPSFDESVKSNW